MKPEGLIESIRQRLLNLAQCNGEAFDFVLARYGIERFLYRMSVSGQAHRFILKGAMLFHVWNHKMHRPTRDLDLLGTGTPDKAQLANAIHATFKRRGTELPDQIPTGLSENFARDKQVMGKAFLRKNGLDHETAELSPVLAGIRKSLEWVWTI